MRKSKNKREKNSNKCQVNMFCLPIATETTDVRSGHNAFQNCCHSVVQIPIQWTSYEPFLTTNEREAADQTYPDAEHIKPEHEG